MSRALAAAVAAALALAACGSSTHSSSSARSPASSSSASSASPASTSTSTPAATATVSSTAVTSSTAAPRATVAGAGCSASQIAVSAAPGGVATGHVGLILRFRNHSASSCVLTGYPGAALSTASGHVVDARRTLSGFLGGLSGTSRPPVLHVAAGQTVSALLEGLSADMAHGGRPCPRYAHLLVTPPNQRVTVRMATPLARICAPQVHPVVAGSDGRS